MAELTPKQEKFAQGLFSGLTQIDAYKNAYNASKMKDDSIYVTASRLCDDPKIKLRIKELQDELKERNMITVEWVLNNLKKVAERCMQEEPVMIRQGNELVESGEYKFEHSGANKSLELLGKHLGMFTDKVEHSGTIEMPVIKIVKGVK